jgi:hypothetical protein
MRPQVVSVGSATTSTVLPVDSRVNPFSIGIAVIVSAGGNLTYTVQHTSDDVFDLSTPPVWLNHSTLVAQTASANGNYAFPIKAVRLNVTIWAAGTATLTLLQGSRF